MQRKRVLELGATTVLVLVLFILVGGGMAWRERQAALRRQLVQALDKEDAARVLRLIKQGADIRLQGTSGTTVLMVAAGPGDAELLALALSSGQDLEGVGTSGHTPLIYAAVYGNASAARVLLARGAKPDGGHRGLTPLVWAARNGDVDTIKALVAAGAEVNTRFSLDLSTPLMRAAERGHEPAVRVLLQAGASTTLQDRQGRTARSRAERKGHMRIVRLLTAQAQTR